MSDHPKLQQASDYANDGAVYVASKFPKTALMSAWLDGYDAAAKENAALRAEPQGHCERSRLATGSLPVSSVDRLRTKWHARAIHLNDMANRVGESASPWNAGPYRIMAEQWDKAAHDLRAEMEARERAPAGREHQDLPRPGGEAVGTLAMASGSQFLPMITATAHDSVGAEFLAGMARHKREHDTKQASWHAELRRQGVVATHPDDGWVDRVNNTLHFCYPHIIGDVKPGALVALGDHEKYRIVRLVSYREWLTALKPGDGTWSFANTAITQPGGQA